MEQQQAQQQWGC